LVSGEDMRRVRNPLLLVPWLIDIDPSYRTRGQILVGLWESQSDTTSPPFLNLSNADWTAHLRLQHASPIDGRSLHSK
jgi:hypothetical protein